MSQHLISLKSKKDIDILANKVLRGLGNPEPPLRLEHVRELLRLDIQHYSSSDPSIFREFVSKFTIAGKQIARRPMLLFEAIKELNIKALFILDGKRILIDETQPTLKHRWNEIHEVSHTIIPWHQDVMYGDTEQSLSPVYREELEAEANYGAGRLLFLGDRFTSESRDTKTTFGEIKELASKYGNTITSTIWRYVESAVTPIVAIVSGHPIYEFNPLAPAEICKHAIYSPAFINQFGSCDGSLLIPSIAQYCSRKKRGPLGSGEIIVSDLNGGMHVFAFETFHNSHQAISLGVYKNTKIKLFATASS
jgi:Zn-dependent peptidase ImmA (M78 family)